MKTIQILEDYDVVLPTDWCRPLQIISMNGGHSDYYAFESCYTGRPENNVKWCRVSQIFGECWYGHSTQQINKIGTPYEFARGDIPIKHQYGKTKPELREDYKNYICNSVINIGKHKGKSFSWIQEHDESYFSWAEHQGIIKSENDFVGD